MLQTHDDQRVRTLTLDRPEALNAFDTHLYDAVREALEDAASSSDIACVVITGAGRAFSAGQDLAEMTSPPRENGRVVHGFPAFLRTVSRFEKPLIAAVNGLAVGIGLTLLPHCDLVLIAETARLRAPFTVLGVAPEAASSALLPEVMGRQRAAHALFTSAWISAQEAVDAGIAWRCVPLADLMPETLAVAREIAAMPIVSLVETKRLLLAPRRDAVDAALIREDAVFQRLVGAPANLEAIHAFMEKRVPDFRHLPPG
ncbi:MAG: paaF 3 [Actinomycetia bacterium]|nr:paaF 3 [Actinomycetes bacterium]